MQSLFSLVMAVFGVVTALQVAPSLAVAAESDAVAVVRTIPEYRMGSGDKIRVITFGEEALTGEFSIGGSGMVSLPLIGEVKAAGLSVPEFQSQVETMLKEGYLK